MTLQFTDLQRDTLAALADTFCAAVPAPVGPDGHSSDPDGFFARTASDLGVPAAAEQYLLAMVPPAQLGGLMQLLGRSETLYDRVRHLDRRMYIEAIDVPASSHPVLSQLDRLKTALGGF